MRIQKAEIPRRIIDAAYISGVRTICSRRYFCDTESWPQSGSNILATACQPIATD